MKGQCADEYALNECLVKVPNTSSEQMFDFEINEENEALRRTKLNQRKRAKIANKLRAKYKENPSLFKEPIDWKTSSNEKRSKDREEKEEKPHKNEKRKNSKKKNKAFRGAQGGSGDSKAYDIEDPKNNKQKVRKAIPQHIKKKRN